MIGVYSGILILLNPLSWFRVSVLTGYSYWNMQICRKWKLHLDSN